MQELWFLSSANYLKLIDIYINLKISWTGFKLKSGHDFVMYKVPREIAQKVQMQELRFLCSARCLMLIDIYMKFREDSLNGFQIIERTRFCYRQMPGENNMSPYPKVGRYNEALLKLLTSLSMYTIFTLNFWTL